MNQRAIANELGVSQTTVSLVLNNPNTEKVSREKREQILHLLNTSKYTSLSRTGKTGNIGYLYPVVTGKLYNSFYDRFISGIENAAKEGGYSLIIEKHHKDETVLYCGKFDGAIIGGNFSMNMLNRLRENIPLVILNSSSSTETQCDSVSPDNTGGIEIALNYLKKMGHSRIAYFAIGIPNDCTDNINYWQRLDAFRNLCWNRHFDLKEGYIQLPKCEQQSVTATEHKIRETLILWSKLPVPPTAVLCCNDEYALWMIHQAKQLGMKIPEILSIIGTDNITPGEFSFPTLTTIDHNAEEMGRLSAEVLIKRILNPDRPQLKMSCNASVVVRESVADLNTKK
jgi:DNA-binding LacI/PurR family transcriptional regulator